MTKRIGVLALIQLLVLCCAVVAQTAPAANDWRAVEQALGRRPGQLQGDGAYKFGLPRGDLKVSVDGRAGETYTCARIMGRVSSSAQGAMLMGDLVLWPCRLVEGGFIPIIYLPRLQRYSSISTPAAPFRTLP